MPKTMTLERLLVLAAHVGIHLERADSSTANLYCWADHEQNVLYLGKAAGHRRLQDEKYWTSGQDDYDTRIYPGFVRLVRENDASCHPLSYDPASFDSSRVPAIIAAERWDDTVDATLLTAPGHARTPAAEDVEQILVRILVHCGVPTGNSQYASQWEGPLGEFSDTMAALAVDTGGR